MALSRVYGRKVNGLQPCHALYHTGENAWLYVKHRSTGNPIGQKQTESYLVLNTVRCLPFQTEEQIQHFQDMLDGDRSVSNYSEHTQILVEYMLMDDNRELVRLVPVWLLEPNTVVEADHVRAERI